MDQSYSLLEMIICSLVAKIKKKKYIISRFLINYLDLIEMALFLGLRKIDVDTQPLVPCWYLLNQLCLLIKNLNIPSF